MIQKLKTGLFVVVLSLISISVLSQEQRKTQYKYPRWVSGKGYWVVETNLNSPLNHLVNFYNNDNVLLFKKSLKGIKLNPAKRKVKMKLKKELESVIMAWERKNNNPGSVKKTELSQVKPVL
jgi:hypothetical protein